MARKEKEAAEAVDELDVNHAEPRVYELGFHLDPDLPTEEVKKSYQKIRTTIEKAGELIAEGEPKKIPLAYTISRAESSGRRDFTTSYFAWIAYEASGAGHEAVVAAAQDAGDIFRFIDVRTTKEAAKHFSEMEDFLAKIPETSEESEEEVSEAEIDAALKEVSA